VSLNRGSRCLDLRGVAASGSMPMPGNCSNRFFLSILHITVVFIASGCLYAITGPSKSCHMSTAHIYTCFLFLSVLSLYMHVGRLVEQETALYMTKRDDYESSDGLENGKNYNSLSILIFHAPTLFLSSFLCVL
jgi:hypothetical protein